MESQIHRGNHVPCVEETVSLSYSSGNQQTNYGLVGHGSHFIKHIPAVPKKYKERMKMLGATLLIVSIIATSAGFISSQYNSDSEEVFHEPGSEVAAAERKGEPTVLQSTVVLPSKRDKVITRHQPVTNTETQNDRETIATSTSYPILPNHDKVQLEPSNNETNPSSNHQGPIDPITQSKDDGSASQGARAAVTTASSSPSQSAPAATSEPKDPPELNPEAKCINEKRRPKDKDQLPQKNYSKPADYSPFSLLIEMRECPTVQTIECRKSEKAGVLAFKAVLQVRSVMEPFASYGTSEKVARKRAAGLAVAKLYGDTVPYDEDEVALMEKVKPEDCIY